MKINNINWQDKCLHLRDFPHTFLNLIGKIRESIASFLLTPCLITENHPLFPAMQFINSFKNENNHEFYKNNISGIEICFVVKRKKKNTWNNDIEIVYIITSINRSPVSGGLTKQQEKLITVIAAFTKHFLRST